MILNLVVDFDDAYELVELVECLNDVVNQLPCLLMEYLKWFVYAVSMFRTVLEHMMNMNCCLFMIALLLIM